MPAKKDAPLRAVGADERVGDVEPVSLLDAVESGDVLAIMLAQRRLIAKSLVSAGDNTRPQYSNELNKLNRLIAEETARRSAASADASVVADLEVEAWDGTGY